VSARWEPDDSLIEGDAGIERIKEALKRHDISLEGRVVTSRDPRMDLVRLDLRRGGMPPGFEQWQLPVWGTGPTFAFVSTASPGAVLPEHSHKRDLFRMVVAGSMLVNGVELKPGDWMYVPKGVPYSYTAGFNPGVVCFHIYS
jgi:hypothetical protein